MKAIALLSGGLDSVVSMLLARQEAEIVLALTIDYGQKARINEIKSAESFCSLYGIKHQIIQLPFMLDMKSGIIESSGMEDSSPWVPNRNGLIINLAACYAENLKADWVICGFNREEGVDFPDNTQEFVQAINRSLYYSTLNKVELRSFVQNMDKIEIVASAKNLGVDFGLIWSCYRSGDMPCGECPSCLRNQKAYEKVGIDYDQNFSAGRSD
ncbi:MAG: 7-cyano-7-deazaguanine synthase QueC [Firmicutes bacterium HGW-Firmicutes-15]|nr:MAG: 7-cyano-7-deazaguanine synthase QueC [Firmicutes bacterium HGW-Firmicutes-15]